MDELVRKVIDSSLDANKKIEHSKFEAELNKNSREQIKRMIDDTRKNMDFIEKMLELA